METWLVREWRCIRQGSAVGLALLVLSCATAYGWWNGWKWSRALEASAHSSVEMPQRELQEARASTEEFDRQNPSAPLYVEALLPGQRSVKGLNPAGLAITGVPVALPPLPAAPLAIGQSDTTPMSTPISIYTQWHDLFADTGMQNPIHLLAGRFDLAFLVIYIFPMLILGLGYNVVSAEREAGTLALLASQPVSPYRIAFRRLLLLMGALLLPLAGAGFATVGVNDGALTAVLLWLAAVAAYAGFWMALVLFVNAQGWSSAANAVVLSCTWIAITLVIPAGANLLLPAIEPMPSRIEYVMALRDARNKSEAETAELRNRYLAKHPEMQLSEVGAGQTFTAQAYALEILNTADEMNGTQRRFDEANLRQQRAADWLRFLSPALLMNDIVGHLAGTDQQRYLRFRQAAVTLLERWHAFFEYRFFTGRRLTSADYAGMPRIEFLDTSAADQAGRTATAVGVLMLLSTALCVAAARRFRIA